MNNWKRDMFRNGKVQQAERGLHKKGSNIERPKEEQVKCCLNCTKNECKHGNCARYKDACADKRKVENFKGDKAK